jgi:hypothetical protein
MLLLLLLLLLLLHLVSQPHCSTLYRCMQGCRAAAAATHMCALQSSPELLRLPSQRSSLLPC